MNNSEFIALGGMLIALVGLITSFILQRDKKKIRELERINKKYKKFLGRSLNAINGYQQIEDNQAKELGKDPSTYRKEIRKKYLSSFTSFFTPGDLKELIQELENE